MIRRNKYNARPTVGQRVRRAHPEEDLQMLCIHWFDRQYPKLAHHLIHIPNGGYRHAREAARFKRLGVRRGVYDLFFAFPFGDSHGLWIELKAGKNTLTPEQRVFGIAMAESGYAVAECRTLEEFQATIHRYI